MDATQVDHVITVAPGGEDTEENKALECRPCHLKESSAEAAQGRNRWKRRPERHPADCLCGEL
jgi:5-methylcytosine-specific restriction endonuclease McrA